MRLSPLAILTLRCPRCRRGRVSRKLVLPNETCPVCGLRFEREPGYFTGAMYASYFLGIVTSAPVWFLLLVLDINPFVILAIAAVQLLIEAPLLFAYSRVIWLHVDNLFNPFDERGDDSAVS